MFGGGVRQWKNDNCTAHERGSTERQVRKKNKLPAENSSFESAEICIFIYKSFYI